VPPPQKIAWRPAPAHGIETAARWEPRVGTPEEVMLEVKEHLVAHNALIRPRIVPRSALLRAVVMPPHRKNEVRHCPATMAAPVILQQRSSTPRRPPDPPALPAARAGSSGAGKPSRPLGLAVQAQGKEGPTAMAPTPGQRALIARCRPPPCSGGDDAGD